MARQERTPGFRLPTPRRQPDHRGGRRLLRILDAHRAERAARVVGSRRAGSRAPAPGARHASTGLDQSHARDGRMKAPTCFARICRSGAGPGRDRTALSGARRPACCSPPIGSRHCRLATCISCGRSPGRRRQARASLRRTPRVLRP
jgi:hypothetical protein